MSVYLVLMDSQPGYLRQNGTPLSLLLAPLGTGTLLDHLYGCVSQLVAEPVMVLSNLEPDAAYEQAIREASAAVGAVVPAPRFERVLSGFEPSDWLLIVDPRCFPADRFALRKMLHDTGALGWAKHLVALDVGSEGTKEYLQFDADGQVDRIQRYYAGLTWLRASGVSCSLIPVASLRMIPGLSFESLSELRRGLAAGGVPGQEVPLSGEMIDLNTEHGLLWLTERFVVETTSRPAPAGYKALVPGVYVGRRCRIDPTARIYGPVVIHDNVVIEAGAVVVGPALLGSGCRVRRNGVLAQCLLMPRTVVVSDVTVRHRVLCDEAATDCFAWTQQRELLPIYRAGAPACRRGGAAGSALRNGAGRRCFYPAFKRIVEAVVALLGLVALSPLLLLTAALIKLTSRGPVLYGDVREGKDCRIFKCWKFRTMVQGAHVRQRVLYKHSNLDGPQFKLERDPRVTRVGHWLRATNLDELPQLINVLLGQMSLIGPRPSPFRENQICVPWRQARLSVRPGITGLWQVCRHDRAYGDFHQWIYYDMLYVRHMSFWLDLKILIATLITLGGRWSVPLSWIIPRGQLHAEQRVWVSPTWLPLPYRGEFQQMGGAELAAATALH